MVSFSSSATGLREKTGSKAKSVVTLTPALPLSRHSFLVRSWRTLPKLQGGNLQSISANLQEGPSCFFFFFFFWLSFLKLLHPQTHLTFWLSAKEFDPWSSRQRISHENSQSELTATNSDSLATDLSRQGSRNGTIAFGTAQTQIQFFGVVLEMWGTYIWVGTIALWFATPDLSIVDDEFSIPTALVFTQSETPICFSSKYTTKAGCGQQQPPHTLLFSYPCDRQAVTLRQHHHLFYDGANPNKSSPPMQLQPQATVTKEKYDRQQREQKLPADSSVDLYVLGMNYSQCF